MFKSLALMALLASPCRAGKFDNPEQDSALPGLKFSGLMDLRSYMTGRDVSWLNGGPNRLRFGGKDTNGVGKGVDRALGVALPQVSLVIDAQVHQDVKVHAQGNFTNATSSVSANVGVIEAYAQVEKSLWDNNFKMRIGGFIPPLSWEHPGVAWSTRYTLTPSAIGSWISEEVRALGAELVWERDIFARGQAKATIGGFSGGDQIGRLLWFRGWTFDDLQGDLAVQFPDRGLKDRPLEQLDGRLGYYGRGDLNFFDHALQLGGGYWTNNAEDNAVTPVPENQPYRTSLYHFGGKWEWGRFTLISQYMKVTVSNFARSPRDWPSAYGLGSAQFGPVRLSFRYDRFWTHWTDARGRGDNGQAYTSFAGYDVTMNQQLSVEYVYSGGRPSQAVRPLAEVDRLVQGNYRLRF